MCRPDEYPPYPSSEDIGDELDDEPTCSVCGSTETTTIGNEEQTIEICATCGADF